MEESTKELIKLIGFLAFVGVVMTSLCYVAIVYGFPSLNNLMDKMTEKGKIISTEDFFYNGTLGMVTYHNGWGGFGGISETVLTFTDGKAFSFSGELQVTVGQNYTVYYRVTTYGDNSTRTENIGITWKST